MKQAASICEKCGASIFVRPGGSSRCEYCGTIIVAAKEPPVPDAILIAEPAAPIQPQRQPHQQQRPRTTRGEWREPPRPSRNDADSWIGRWLFRQAFGRLFSGCFSALFVLGFFGFFIGSIVMHEWSSNSRRRQRDITRTNEKITRAVDRMEDEAARLNRLPRVSEANRTMGSNRDEWRNELRYEILNDREFLVRSFGPDGRQDTSDDIVQKRRVSFE